MKIKKVFFNFWGCKYEVHSDGNIFSFQQGGHKRRIKMRGTVTTNGYVHMSLGKRPGKLHLMHRLVAKYFCKGYSKYKVVNHKDGNRKNNNFKNLEWVSHSENLKHGHKTLGSRSRACKFYGGRYIQRIKTTGKYSAVFYYFGERYHLGSFDSEKIAEKVLNDVRKSHGLKSGDYLC